MFARGFYSGFRRQNLNSSLDSYFLLPPGPSVLKSKTRTSNAMEQFLSACWALPLTILAAAGIAGCIIWILVSLWFYDKLSRGLIKASLQSWLSVQINYWGEILQWGTFNCFIIEIQLVSKYALVKFDSWISVRYKSCHMQHFVAITVVTFRWENNFPLIWFR